MEVYFHDPSHDRLEVDRGYTLGHSAALVSAYRKRIQQLRAVRDESDLFALQCLRARRLESNPSERISIQLDDRHVLIVELRPQASHKAAWVLGIHANEQ